MVQLPAQNRTKLGQGCLGPCLIVFCAFPRMESPQPRRAPVPGLNMSTGTIFFPRVLRQFPVKR